MNRIAKDAEVEFHPAADLFPPMHPEQFRELVEDIRIHGQLEPVWVTDAGEVIDGRHRIRACAELGRSVDARTYHGDDEAIAAFVVSLNLQRRHLNVSQRAMVATRLANLRSGQRKDYATGASNEAAVQAEGDSQHTKGASNEAASRGGGCGCPHSCKTGSLCKF